MSSVAADKCAVGSAAPSGPGPLGPDSLTWRWFGEWRTLALALWAGSLQNMHPGLGAGVEAHSSFFDERWARVLRSLYPITGVVYDGPRAARTAREVVGYHRRVHGVDGRGRRYNALDPETFYWAHATFLMVPVVANELLGTPLPPADKEQLYAESRQWYALYGLSMRPVPPDWAAFERYWDRMCTEVLEDNVATRRVLDLGGMPRPDQLRRLPEPLWWLVRLVATRIAVWITVGAYPPVVRARLGYRWSRTDALVLGLTGRLAGRIWRLVPHDRRYHPRARAGWEAARARAVLDAEPVETPERNLPPIAERNDPSHYVPARPA